MSQTVLLFLGVSWGDSSDSLLALCLPGTTQVQAVALRLLVPPLVLLCILLAHGVRCLVWPRWHCGTICDPGQAGAVLVVPAASGHHEGRHAASVAAGQHGGPPAAVSVWPFLYFSAAVYQMHHQNPARDPLWCPGALSWHSKRCCGGRRALSAYSGGRGL